MVGLEGNCETALEAVYSERGRLRLPVKRNTVQRSGFKA
jgi:hypothetical protein